MQSTVHLFNTALARLGGEQLSLHSSPLEQDSLGRICENLFPHVLDMTLAAYAWAFAVRRQSLAAPVLEEGMSNPSYPHAFELPADCVKPLRLFPASCSPGCFGGVNPPARSLAASSAGALPAALVDGMHYVIEGRTLRCAEPHAVLVYVARIGDPKLWPPVFADALAWGLAGELAAAKNNDPRKQQWCYQNSRIALADAVAVEQRDQNPHRKQSGWTAARFGE